MSNYLIWDKLQDSNILKKDNSLMLVDLFNQGYLFTRESPGSLYKTRSLRLNLNNFTFNSENRRIFNKTEGLTVEVKDLPFLKEEYDWNIHKLGKEYYEKKFGKGVFSANKIKELLTTEHNFNKLLIYKYHNDIVGYAITFMNDKIMQYAYPFYDLEKFQNNFGMGMMLNVIKTALDNNLEYIYLGSLSRAEDVYKLQFNNIEWFNETYWETNLDKVKQLITSKD